MNYFKIVDTMPSELIPNFRRWIDLYRSLNPRRDSGEIMFFSSSLGNAFTRNEDYVVRGYSINISDLCYNIVKEIDKYSLGSVEEIMQLWFVLMSGRAELITQQERDNLAKIKTLLLEMVKNDR
jgi:hypothetical protein